MSGELKSSSRRLQRLAQIRKTLTDAAEASVRESEREILMLEAARETISGKIETERAGIAYCKTSSGSELQLREEVIESLRVRRESVQLSLEDARRNLESRRYEWREAMSRQRIAEKIRDRKLLELSRKTEAVSQKAMDDTFAGRLIRKRKNR